MADILTITKIEGKVVVFHLAGRLDGQTESILMQEARQTFDSGARALLIDLTDLEMITSAGLRAFHQIYKLFTPRAEIEQWQNEKHGEPYKSKYFKVAGANSRIYYVLNLAGFLQNIPIYRDVQLALESF
jgi:ABC-type transporter Mla MlaB component